MERNEAIEGLNSQKGEGLFASPLLEYNSKTNM